MSRWAWSWRQYSTWCLTRLTDSTRWASQSRLTILSAVSPKSARHSSSLLHSPGSWSTLQGLVWIILCWFGESLTDDEMRIADNFNWFFLLYLSGYSGNCSSSLSVSFFIINQSQFWKRLYRVFYKIIPNWKILLSWFWVLLITYLDISLLRSHFWWLSWWTPYHFIVFHYLKTIVTIVTPTWHDLQ